MSLTGLVRVPPVVGDVQSGVANGLGDEYAIGDADEGVAVLVPDAADEEATVGWAMVGRLGDGRTTLLTAVALPQAVTIRIANRAGVQRITVTD